MSVYIISPMSERIAIYGGAGRWGARIDQAAKDQGHETLVVDPAAELKVDPTEAAKWATVLGLAVFPSIANQLIEELDIEITSEKIVFDICGRKNEIIPNLRKLNTRNVSVVSTHPLSNEKQPPRGQKVLIMPVGDMSGEATDFVVNFFSQQQMVPQFLDLELHDEIMAPNQGFVHSIQRSTGHAIVEKGLDLDALWTTAPANGELFWPSQFRGWNQPSAISAQAIDSFLRTTSGIPMLRSVQSHIGKMIEIVQNETDPEKSQKALADLFDEDFLPLQTQPISKEMQERTTIILERLANLRLQSITVHSEEDKPGVLHAITGTFAENGLNLTAQDSHIENGGIKFMIGHDKKDDDPDLLQTILNLRERGFRVDTRDPQ